jgi:DNA-binding transcriptional LysR family regulator
MVRRDLEHVQRNLLLSFSTISDNDRMELRHLEYFLAVADELNFTRASARLHVVQSGVSAAIRSLERELGVTLFERSTQKVELSDAGAALLPRARAVLDAAQEAREAVVSAEEGLLGTLDIGTMTAHGLVDLPALLGDFHARYPRVTLRLRAAPSGSGGLAQQLLAGSLDVAFLSVIGRPPAGLTARELGSVPMRLVLPAGHPLSGMDGVPMALLAGEPFVDSPPGYGNRVVADRAFAAAGIARQVTLEVANLPTVADYVRQGLGVALIPELDLDLGPDLLMLPLLDAEPRWPVSVATSSTRRPSAAVRALLALVDQHVAGSLM